MKKKAPPEKSNKEKKSLNFIQYKGYKSVIKYSNADKLFYGKVDGTDDLVSFEGRSIEELQKDFEGAIDDWLED